MSDLQTLFVVFAGFSLAATLIVVVIAAILGRDIPWMERQKVANPAYYQRSKMAMKFNGPLVVMMCAVILPVSIVVAVMRPSKSVFLASIPISAIGLWLAIRWSRWAWRQ
jgi:hypothetical protein